jgi:hypothetical protein
MSITSEGIAGMESSATHAEQHAPGWGARAYASVCRYPIIFGADTPFTMEAARQWAYAMGLDRPAEERAWGAVTQKLVRDGVIEPVGYGPAASSHGSPKRTYRITRPGTDPLAG